MVSRKTQERGLILFATDGSIVSWDNVINRLQCYFCRVSELIVAAQQAMYQAKTTQVTGVDNPIIGMIVLALCLL